MLLVLTLALPLMLLKGLKIHDLTHAFIAKAYCLPSTSPEQPPVTPATMRPPQ
jgi:hypothetical protein